MLLSIGCPSVYIWRKIESLKIMNPDTGGTSSPVSCFGFVHVSPDVRAAAVCFFFFFKHFLDNGLSRKCLKNI